VRPRSRGWSSIFLALEQLSLAAGTGWLSTAAVAAWKRGGVEAGERLVLLLLLLLLLLTQLTGSRKGEEGGGGGKGEAEQSPEIGEKI
jgi:hypothetical protein